MSAIYNEYLIFHQDKGPDVELAVDGDEFYARYETTDGYTEGASSQACAWVDRP
jgi:hypothetical protein